MGEMSADELKLPNGVTVRHERGLEMVYTAWTPTLDPKWRYTDKAGHDHSADDLYATLDWVVDVPGGSDSDGEEYPDEGHYECKRCHENIVPHSRVDPFPYLVVVDEHWYINDEPSTKEAVMDLVNTYQRTETE